MKFRDAIRWEPKNSKYGTLQSYRLMFGTMCIAGILKTRVGNRWTVDVYGVDERDSQQPVTVRMPDGDEPQVIQMSKAYDTPEEAQSRAEQLIRNAMPKGLFEDE